MAGLINDLIEILKSQAKNYNELLVLSTEKRNVIIKNDVDMLQKITQAENSIIGRNQRMENKRMELVKNIANVLNKEADNFSLSALAEIIKDQKEYGELEEIRHTLKENLDLLKIENDRNAILLNSSLEYIDFSLNLLRQSPMDEALYTTKKHKPGEGKGFFDKKS